MDKDSRSNEIIAAEQEYLKATTREAQDAIIRERFAELKKIRTYFVIGPYGPQGEQVKIGFVARNPDQHSGAYWPAGWLLTDERVYRALPDVLKSHTSLEVMPDEPFIKKINFEEDHFLEKHNITPPPGFSAKNRDKLYLTIGYPVPGSSEAYLTDRFTKNETQNGRKKVDGVVITYYLHGMNPNFSGRPRG